MSKLPTVPRYTGLVRYTVALALGWKAIAIILMNPD